MSHFVCKAARVFLFSAVSAVMMAGFASAAESNIAVAVGQTTGSGLRAREYPTTDADVVFKMEKGTTLAILDGSEEGYIGYVSADYLKELGDGEIKTYARVNEAGIYVRSGPSMSAEVLEIIDSGAYVTVTGFEDGWYEVTCKYGTVGYIRSDHLDMTDNNGTTTVKSSAKGSSVAATALKYKGYRYIYGGSTPSGFDCSGFTMYVYKQYGISLPHSASSQWTNSTGTRVYSMSKLQPGDLVFFRDPRRVQRGKACSHVGMYIGDGKMIHASSSKTGVIVSSLYSGSYQKYFVGGKHIL